MPGVSIGSVSVSVTPDARGFTAALKSQILPQADALGRDVGDRISAGINSALHDVTVSVSLDMTAADAQIAELGTKLDELGVRNISPTVGLDDTRIVAALDDLGVKLSELDDSITNIRLELEDGSAVARLDEISLKLDEIGDRDVTARLSLDDSGFNRQLDEDMAKLSAAGAASGGGGGGGIGSAGLIGGAVLGGLAASPALPGVLTGGGAAIGTLGLAVQGIGPALSAYTAMQTAAATATGKTGAAAISAASQIHSAQQAVSTAETQAGHDAVTSAESIKNAHTAVAQAVAQAAQAQVSAEEQLSNAQYAEKQAQQELTGARQQAILTLQQLHDAEADTTLSAEQAQLDLEQAKLNAETTDKSATATALQKQQADLSVAEAQQRLKEALEAKTNAANASNKADKEGVSGLPAVVAAQHNLAQAHQSVGDAQRALTQAEQSGAAAITKAQQSLADAVRNASWQQQGDALSVSNAQYGLRAAYAAASTGSTSAATAAAKYAAALAGLSPGGQQMVKDIIGLKGGFDSLKTVAQGAIAPGFTEFVKGIHALLPAITTEVQSMGSIIGGALTAMGAAFQSSGFQATLKDLFTQGNQFLQIVGPAIGAFLEAFGEAGAKSGPAVEGLANGLAAIVRGLGDMMTNLAPAAGAIGSVLSTLGQAIGAIGGPLGSILGDIVRLLAPLLSAALPLFKQLLGDLVKALGPLVTALLPPLRATLAELAAPLQQGGTLLGQMAGAVGQVIIALLPLLPALTKLAVALLPIMIQQFTLTAPLIRGVADVLAVVVQWLVPVVTWIANLIAAIVNWTTSLNGIKSVMGDVASFITGAWNQVYQNVSAIIGHIINFYKQSWSTISSGVKSAYNTISSFITGSWNQTYQGISGIIGKLITFLSGSWNKMVTDAKSIWNGLTGWITGTLANAFKTAFQNIVNGIAGVWNTMKNVAEGPVKFLIDVIYDQGIVSVVNAVGGLIGLHLNAVHPGGLATGGKITEGTTPTADDVLARVSKGETVVSAAHSQALAPFFSAVGVPGYADGGIPNPIGFVQHEASSVWKAAIGGLKDLTGDAVAVAAKHILDPLISEMPGGGTPLGSAIKKIPETIVNDLIGKIKGATAGVSGGVGGGSGADVAKYAAGFATGHGHPYVWGGSSPSGWDCSGFSADMYEHFGYFPEKEGTRHGTSQSQFSDPLLQGSGAVPGALAFFNGSDGPIGHVGVVLNPKSYVSAYDTAEGTVTKPITGSLGFRIPKGGFQSGIHMPPDRAQAWMSAHMKDYGWSGGEFGSLKTLWNNESGWRYNAQNPHSPAYGIPQADPGSKMASVNADWRDDAITQMKWGAQYIKAGKGYGTPSKTLALWNSRSPHWYDSGGWMPPGLSLNMNGTGRPEPVLSGAQWDAISSVANGSDGGFGMAKAHKKFDRMIHLLEQAPARTAGGVGGVINGSAHDAVQRAFFRTR